MKNGKTKPPLELVGAKVPPEIKNEIERQAVIEERSVSQIIARLLASHPTIVKAAKQNRTAKASA